MSEFGEFGLIARYFMPLAEVDPAGLGLIDDAAILDTSFIDRLVVTADTLVAGVHFLPHDPPDSVAWKLLAVNLSDLAAMGATPKAYVLCLALPKEWGKEVREGWLTSFAGGLELIQREFRLALVGGDTVSTPGALTLSVTAFGTLHEGPALLRSGARAGDDVWVSGEIGNAALGLKALHGELSLNDEQANKVIMHYRKPYPRIDLGRRIVQIASSCMDISDGLVADLIHICTASDVKAIVEARLIPLSIAGRQCILDNPSLLLTLLGAGDDYELLFTAAAQDEVSVRAAASACGNMVTKIGRIVAQAEHKREQRVIVLDAEGERIEVDNVGWEHFCTRP